MKSISLHRLGLRGRLFAAFGAVAATTVLAGATAFVSYDRLGRSLEVVTGTSLPHVTRASNIAVAAAEVVGQAQALLAASGADDRTRALKALAAEHATLVAAGRSAHEKLSEKLVPMVDDAAFALTLAIEQAADKGQLADVRRTLGTLADNDLVALQTTLELRAEANLLLGVLVEAADLRNREQMPPIKDRFVAAASHLDRAAVT